MANRRIPRRRAERSAMTRWPAAAIGILVSWGVAQSVLPQGAPVGVVLAGCILGAATALTAIGLILIYRANRVINFASGAMGASTGLAAVNLYLSWRWPYLLALAIGVVSGVLVGILTEFFIIRRFSRSSRLVLSVATIGLAQALGGLELLLPGWIFGDSGGTVTLGGYQTPLSSMSFEIDSTVIDGNHLLILAVVPLMAGCLAWFLRRSATGTAVRAAAENADRARLLGIPVGRISLVVWGLAGALTTATFLLKAPIVGTPPTAGTGPAILLPALAAALIARMESLPVACAAAVVLGAIDQVTRWNTTTPALADVVLLVVILGSLLLRRGASSRASDLDGTWQDSAMSAPVPRVIRVLPEYRWGTRGLVAAGLIAAALLPLWLGPTSAKTLSVAVIWGIVAVSIVVLTGWGGQISLGQFALVGVGAVVAGNLMVRWNVDFFVSLVAAAGASSLAALLIGFPALRIRGPFLAVVTLSFAVVLDGYLLNPDVFPDLIPGDLVRPVLLQRWPLTNERTFAWLCLGVLGLVLLGVRGLRRARSGRVIMAVRDNRRAAEAMAVPGRWIGLGGFVVSGAIAGTAGALQVIALQGIGTQAFPPIDSVDVFSWTTIGGLSSVLGGLFGTVGLRLTRALVDPAAKLLLSGVALLAVLWLLPGGLAQAAIGLRDRAVGLLARRRGIALADRSASSVVPHVAGARGPTAEGLLSGRAVSVRYGQLQVLFDVDLDIHQGEIVALLGTNGAGKSTVLKAMAGLVPSSGTVRLDGCEISGATPEALVKLGLALMPGGRSVFPTLTVAEHLRLATWTFRRDTTRVGPDTEAVLDLFPVLRTRWTTAAGDMSGGEQQQLALAQTLLLRPRVLLIDELSLGLSPTIVADLLEVVRGLNSAGTTVLIVEQSINVALSVADRAIFMEKGQVRFEGPAQELLDRPDVLRAVFLHGTSRADDVAPSIDLTGLDPVRDPSWPADQPILECVGLVKRFGGVVAVDHVDLAVGPGEIVGLIGQNGAGKTTILDCISGFLAPDGGSIRFRGRDISDWAPHDRAAARLGRSFQEARLFPSLTVGETIAVARERQATSHSFVADAFRQPASYESELAVSTRVDELIELLGLVDQRDTLTSALSTGTRRIVELACLLAAEPLALLLDEPSAGVAQRETEALGPLLANIREVTGVSMLVIEHDMPLLSGLCDRLVALDLGAVLAQGSPAEVLADPLVVASYLGDDAVAINRSG